MPASGDQSYLLNERRAGLAIVVIDRAPSFLDADSVVSANREGALGGVRHLIAHGHRRIAFLGDLMTISTARERLAGYQEALHGAGLAVDESMIRRDLHSIEAAESAISELLALPPGEAPSALFTSQNFVTIGAVKTLRRLGLQHSVALVGFDDVLLADLLEPAMTVVAQDPAAIGAAAAELLFRRLDGDTSPTQALVIPTRLVVRGSGEIQSPRLVASASRWRACFRQLDGRAARV